MILNSPALALSSLTSRFLFSHLLLGFIILLVSVLCHLLCFLEFLGQANKFLLILSSSVLKDLLHTITVISCGCCLVKLLAGKNELGLCCLEVLLKLLDTTIEAVELGFGGHHLSLLLLLLHLRDSKLFGEDVKLSLKCF